MSEPPPPPVYREESSRSRTNNNGAALWPAGCRDLKSFFLALTAKPTRYLSSRYLEMDTHTVTEQLFCAGPQHDLNTQPSDLESDTLPQAASDRRWTSLSKTSLPPDTLPAIMLQALLRSYTTSQVGHSSSEVAGNRCHQAAGGVKRKRCEALTL
ncbi:hypothetical protein AGIG_G14686 [Arapaima gigas]